MAIFGRRSRPDETTGPRRPRRAPWRRRRRRARAGCRQKWSPRRSGSPTRSTGGSPSRAPRPWSPWRGRLVRASPRCSTRLSGTDLARVGVTTTDHLGAAGGHLGRRADRGPAGLAAGAPAARPGARDRRERDRATGTGSGSAGRAGAAGPARPRLDGEVEPAPGGPVGAAGRRDGVGGRPAEVRRRRAARALPAAAGRARAGDGGGAEPDRPAAPRRAGGLSAGPASAAGLGGPGEDHDPGRLGRDR